MPQFDEDRESATLAGKRILVAEDKENLRTILSMMIKELGAEVVAVPDGKRALDCYFSNENGIDLVLLDMRMEGLSGAAVFKQLLKSDPAVKVVLSSGVPPDEEIAKLLLSNNGGFLYKPFTLDTLSEVLSTVLSGRPIVRKIEET